MSQGPEIVIKQTLAIVDAAFTPAAVANYSLSVLVSAHRIQFAVLDIQRQTLLGVKEFEAEHQDFFTKQELLQSLNNIEPWLSLPFHQVKLAFFFAKNLFIPHQLSASIDKQLLVKNHFKVAFAESLQTYPFPRLDADCLMAVPQKALDWAKKTFPIAKILALPVCFLQKSFLLETTIHVWLDGRNMILSVIKNKQMQFCNTFSYSTPDEAAYYLLFTLQQLGEDAQQTTLEVSGSIHENDGLHELLRKYIYQINFAPKTAGFYFSPALQSVPSQQFDLLYFLNHCE